jgi:hypothetical protein
VQKKSFYSNMLSPCPTYTGNVLLENGKLCDMLKNKIFYMLLSPALSFMSFLRETLREIKDTQMYVITHLSWFRQQICHRGRGMAVCGRG